MQTEPAQHIPSDATHFPYVMGVLYHFADFPEFAQHRYEIRDKAESLGLRGSLLIAKEGINGSLVGTQDALHAMRDWLEATIPAFKGLTFREYPCDSIPYKRMKVRLKKEIVAMKNPFTPVGANHHYVSPDQWDALLDDPELIVIDTRNDYEFDLGTFKGAVNPKTASFGEFPEWVAQNIDPKKHPKVAMFCTGGVRCEKAGPFLAEQGFEQVYELEGGILNYLKQTENKTGGWEGGCFVFDDRVVIDDQFQTVGTICCKCFDAMLQEEVGHKQCREGGTCHDEAHAEENDNNT